MKNILTFIIPVRHQENSVDWANLKNNLTETVTSISEQKSKGWKAIIVANYGAELPQLPPGFEVKRVNFPPNQLHEQGNSNQEEFRNALRLDKGRRVLAGMLYAGEMGHVMVVDDDDLVSSNLTSYVAANPCANGWYIRDGFIWSGGKTLYRYRDFSRLCGTSHIIRADLYRLPSRLEDAQEAFIRCTLGSHIFLHDELDAAGMPLEPLPFIGAVYRTGHVGSWIKSRGIFKQFFWHKFLIRRPFELLRRLSRLHIMTENIRREFFGHAIVG